MVALYVRGRECLGIYPDAVDTGVSPRATNHQLGVTVLDKRVIGIVVKLALNGVVYKDAGIVQTGACGVVVGIKSIHNIRGNPRPSILSPLCVLVFPHALVLGHQGHLRRSHLQSVDVMVIHGVHVAAQFDDRGFIISDVRFLHINLDGHVLLRQSVLRSCVIL